MVLQQSHNTHRTPLLLTSPLISRRHISLSKEQNLQAQPCKMAQTSNDGYWEWHWYCVCF